MSDSEVWLYIGALCAATAVARCSLWLAGNRITIAPRVQEMLRFAPACALAAIIAPDIFMNAGGHVQTTLANPKLLAAVAATLFYLWRKNMVLTIVFGMLVFTGLRLALST